MSIYALLYVFELYCVIKKSLCILICNGSYKWFLFVEVVDFIFSADAEDLQILSRETAQKPT